MDELDPYGSTNAKQEYVGSYDPNKHTMKKNPSPLSSECSRNIIWELDRPALEPLTELNDDMTKDEIIPSLYQQMFPSQLHNTIDYERLTMQQVDLHLFDRRDKNNLFYNLLLGLIDSSQLKPGGKSVEELRRELMHHLIDIPLDCKLGDKTVEQQYQVSDGTRGV